MSTKIKIRLLQLHKTQLWLVGEIKSRGVKTTPGELSLAINEHCTEPKAMLLLEMADAILTEAETIQKGA